MYGGVSFFLQLLNLPTRKRLALVLVIFAVSLGCYELAFPAAYFGCLLLLPLLSAAWLFGWRGGPLSQTLPTHVDVCVLACRLLAMPWQSSFLDPLPALV